MNNLTVVSQIFLLHADSFHDVLGLTSKEIDVIGLLLEGLRVVDVANLLNRSVKTISSHKRMAFKKLSIQHDTMLYPTIMNYVFQFEHGV